MGLCEVSWWYIQAMGKIMVHGDADGAELMFVWIESAEHHTWNIKNKQKM